jgi:hypothetical protein
MHSSEPDQMTGLISAIDPRREETWRDTTFLTLDVDWATDDVLEYALALMRERQLRCTVFATHASGRVESIREDCAFEVGVHPNFQHLCAPDGADGRQYQPLDELQTLFPAATAVRSHSLVQSSRLQNEFARRGLTHDCNTYVPSEARLPLRPWTIWNGLIKVPFVFADDFHLYGGDVRRDLPSLLDAELRVLAFHPIHLYLNTDCIDTYEGYKRGASQGQAVEGFVNQSRYGVRDLFHTLADALRL